MLDRYTRPFSVQHFSNLSLKGNTIEFRSCPICYSTLKIALMGWGYRVFHSGGVPTILRFFFETPSPIKTYAPSPWGAPPN